MGADTKIAWTNHTFNFLRGCRHSVLDDGSVSPACLVCYAERMSHRNPAALGEWGAGGRRVVGAESYWRQPVKWNADAEKAEAPAYVFTSALADLFEGADVGGVESRGAIRPDYVPHLGRLWALIRETPWLRWQLLTKRPWNMARWAKEHGWPSNAWAGTTTENGAAAEERAPWLSAIGAPVRFLSIEPMAGPVSVGPLFGPWQECCGRGVADGNGDGPFCCGSPDILEGVNWVIVGGASGPRAPMLDLDAARKVVTDCRAAGVPVFVKQLGEAWARANGSATKAGTDPNEWPEDLRVQEFPHAR